MAQKKTDSLNLPVKDGDIYIERIEDINGVTKDQIFERAKKWFVRSFNDSKEVVKNENKQEGTIMGVAILPISTKDFVSISYNVKFVVEFTARDGKYRVRFQDFSRRVLDSEYAEYRSLTKPWKDGKINKVITGWEDDYKFYNKLLPALDVILVDLKKSLAKNDDF
ncbi:DUF4468 domain-containing protein [Pedobacter sp.]|uniref:DUF4468 domain-containing protein n=1 Tax=Pedobacter sp. TaxID=1411316 RepID=UPI00396C7D02